MILFWIHDLCILGSFSHLKWSIIIKIYSSIFASIPSIYWYKFSYEFQIISLQIMKHKCELEQKSFPIFYFLFKLVFIHYFFEVPESLRSIVEHLWFFDAFANNFIENDLKAYWNATFLQIIVVLFPNLLYFRVLLSFFFRAQPRLIHICQYIY